MEQKKFSETDLKYFIGTEQYYKDFLGILLTDGVKFLAENGKCYWAITDISIYCMKNKNNFYKIEIKKITDNKTNLLITTENDNGQKIKVYENNYLTDLYTYFDGDLIEMFFCDGVLMLISEY
jgi:hypothetical protein